MNSPFNTKLFVWFIKGSAYNVVWDVFDKEELYFDKDLQVVHDDDGIHVYAFVMSI
jgi:hypothetical protein